MIKTKKLERLGCRSLHFVHRMRGRQHRCRNQRILILIPDKLRQLFQKFSKHQRFHILSEQVQKFPISNFKMPPQVIQVDIFSVQGPGLKVHLCNGGNQHSKDVSNEADYRNEAQYD